MKVIFGKYGVEEGGWCSLEVKEGYGMGLWKATRKGLLSKARFPMIWVMEEGQYFRRIFYIGTPL